MNRTVLIAIAAAVVLLIAWFALTGPSPDPVAETEQPMAPATGTEPATGAAEAEPPAEDQAVTDPVTGDEAEATTLGAEDDDTVPAN